jgi:hypothetical protein
MRSDGTIRDSQRGRVYAAEQLARSVYDAANEPLSLKECQRLVDRATRVRGRFRTMFITVRPGKGHRRAVAYPSGKMQLPLWARTKPVVLHETAHFIAGLDQHHGPRFCSIYLKLLKRFIGPLEAEIMREAYKQYNVKHRGKSGSLGRGSAALY